MHITDRANDLEPVFLHGFKMRPPGDERYLVARVYQTRTVIGAKSTGSKDGKTH